VTGVVLDEEGLRRMGEWEGEISKDRWVVMG